MQKTSCDDLKVLNVSFIMTNGGKRWTLVLVRHECELKQCLNQAMLHKWWRQTRRSRCTGGGFKPP